jgi:C_GCAxxG_C_C family probable redox protein
MKESKQEIAERADELAKKYMLKNHNCAQCVIASVFETLGIEDKDAFRAACGLARGVGGTGEGTCGAITGGVIAMSHLFGRKWDDFHDTTKIRKSVFLSRQLMNKFKEKYDTSCCKDLQIKLVGRSFDLFKPGDLEAMQKTDLHEKCSVITGETARIVAELIIEQQEKDTKDAKAS